MYSSTSVVTAVRKCRHCKYCINVNSYRLQDFFLHILDSQLSFISCSPFLPLSFPLPSLLVLSGRARTRLSHPRLFISTMVWQILSWSIYQDLTNNWMLTAPRHCTMWVNGCRYMITNLRIIAILQLWSGSNNGAIVVGEMWGHCDPLINLQARILPGVTYIFWLWKPAWPHSTNVSCGREQIIVDKCFRAHRVPHT